ncbi:30S ribosomal protein S21 [Candidatus Roizmanbacteria bacterium]|nr:30S ribosomal protein S21 [Candidatus Roizmanbacteria bacterium]
MVMIQKKKGDSKDAIFRKFTKAFIEENVVDEVRKRMFYKKPSLKRKEEEKERTTRKPRRIMPRRITIR